MVTRRAVAWLTLCLAAPAAAQGAAGDTMKVTPDRSVVASNETFNVKFTTGSGKASAPDWSPLNKDFKVLSKRKSVQKTIVNGVARTVHEWNVSLQPKRAGKLQIPPLKFGAVRSAAKPIQVKPPPKAQGKKRPAEEFFIEVSAEPKNPYVQAQMLFTLRVFMLYPLRGSVTPPQSGSKAIVESLGDARKYHQNRGGRRYDVYERRYLIYPQNSGDMKINPVGIKGTYVKQGRRFSVNKRSRALTLKVRPVPASFPGKIWLPARSFKISQNWSADLSSWRAGEPITRTLNFQADGLLAKQVPEIDLPVGDGFRFYTESADFKNERRGKTIVGRRQQSAVLIPAQAGAYTLPGVKVPWWNTRTDRLEFAELPTKDVTVSEAAFSALTVDEPAAGGNQPGNAEQEPVAFEVAVEVNNLWFWVSAALLFGWLATVAMMWRGAGLYRLLRDAWQRRETMRERRRAVRQACEGNDAVATRDALMQWSRVMWPDRAPTSLGQIGALCSSTGNELVEQQIRRLERALYARDRAWQGSLLWDAFSSQQIAPDRGRSVRAGGLEPLHRL